MLLADAIIAFFLVKTFTTWLQANIVSTIFARLIEIHAKMKKTILIISCMAAALALSSCCNAQKGGTDNVAVLEELLMNRKSVRSYSDQEVSEELLLKVLWAANGVNREDGRRTAPSAINAQDVELYLCTDVTYHYNAQTGSLEKQADADIRPEICGRNSFGLSVPVILLCSDQTKFQRGPGGPRPSGPRPEGAPAGPPQGAPAGPDGAPAAGQALNGAPVAGQRPQGPAPQQAQENGISRFSGLDVGIVSQNISLYCVAAGLGTVACAPRIDSEAVQSALGLPSTMIPLLYHPIGYPAE